LEFISLERLNINICIESENGASLFPHIIGLRGVDLVLEKDPTLQQLEKIRKISVLIPNREKRKTYQTTDFKFFKGQKILELGLDKKSRRELRQDLILAKTL